MKELTKRQVGIIKHALTGGRGFVYRNHYVCEWGRKAYSALIGLCRMGYAREVLSPFPEIEQSAFVITRAGAHHVGLHLPGEKWTIDPEKEKEAERIAKRAGFISEKTGSYTVGKGAKIPPGELEPGKVEVLEDDPVVMDWAEKHRIDPHSKSVKEQLAESKFERDVVNVLVRYGLL